MGFATINLHGGGAATATCVTVRGEMALATVMAPFHRYAGSAELECVVHAVAKGMNEHRIYHAPYHHADHAVITVCNLAANNCTRYTANARTNFIANAATSRDAVVVDVDRPVFALLMLALLVCLLHFMVMIMIFWSHAPTHGSAGQRKPSRFQSWCPAQGRRRFSWRTPDSYCG